MSFNHQNYQFTTGKYYNENVIFAYFPYNLLLKDELKGKFSSAKWSVSYKCWYLPDTKASVQRRFEPQLRKV